ncbi:MAG TPA: AI-2E family transporter [Steroidobacteraceae bacterium]|nr:AI-2E family transporter [Steroidobacteraceae bacterium]
MTSPGSSTTEGRRPTAVTFVVVSGAVLAVLYLLREILLPFVLAGIVAYVCTPLIDLAARRAHGHRWLFALLVLLVLMGLAALLGFYGLPTAAHQLLDLAASPREVIDGFVRVLMGNRSFNIGGASLNAAQISERAAAGLSSIVTNGNRMLAAALVGFGAMFEMILTWVILGYLLFDAPRLSQGLLWIVSPAQRPAMLRFWGRFNPILRRYFVGIALVVVYASIAAYIGLGLFLGLHHALLLALLTGLLELLPVIGPVSSAVLAGLVAVRQAAGASAILAFIAYAIALRLSIDQFFGPLVIGKAAHVRPVLVIFCFLAGGLLLGVSGVILAVPIALGIKVALSMRNEQCAPDYAGGAA